MKNAYSFEVSKDSSSKNSSTAAYDGFTQTATHIFMYILYNNIHRQKPSWMHQAALTKTYRHLRELIGQYLNALLVCLVWFLDQFF